MATLRVAHPPEQTRVFPGNFFNWEWIQSEDVKELAYGLRLVSELTALAYKGLRVAVAEDRAPDSDDIYELIGDLADQSSLGAIALAQKLHALPEEGA